MSTIHEYAELLKQRKLSSVELTKQYLARIEKDDSQIGSYITVCLDEALAAPSFPSQLEWKIGLPWANTRGILNSPS